MLSYIVWNVNPQLIEIGNFQIRWYGVLFALAFYLSFVIMSKIFKKDQVEQGLLDKLTIYIVVGTVLGARLGHVLFYSPQYYLSNPIKIFKIWEGGLASHGAAIGILLASYLFSRKYNKKLLWLLDRLTIAVAISGFLVRTGNLMNSEIYGIPTNMPWAFIFEREDSIPRHPTQIYEGLSYLTIFFVLFYLYFKKNAGELRGYIFSVFLIMLFSARFLLEFLKENQERFEDNMFLNLGQILSIPFILFGIFLLIRIKIKKQGLE